MHVVIKFETSGAGFEDDFPGQLGELLEQAGHKMIRQMRRAPGARRRAPETDYKLLDVNGNTVGTVSVEARPRPGNRFIGDSGSDPRTWFMERYDIDHFGLKCSRPHDGRGVPEGSQAEWRSVIEAIKQRRAFTLKRLAYVPGVTGIVSPRNTNRGNTTFDERFVVKDADQVSSWLEWVLDALVAGPVGAEFPPEDAREAP